MHLPRKSLAAAALVLALFGTSASGSAHALGAPGGQGHGVMVRLATLEPRMRPRRRVGSVKVREILRLTTRRARTGVRTVRAQVAGLRARLALRGFWARGPPRAPNR